MIQHAKPTVGFIVGPTASGKTDAALALALALRKRGRKAEIVNADSRQIYRGMTIGTAKPSREYLAAVPHHLIDIADPSDGFSLARFLTLARDAIKDISSRDAVPLVVGGTGQYVWGLVDGWEVPDVSPNAAFRARLEREAETVGGKALFERLCSADPDAVAYIDWRNTRRVIRALEVIEATGQPFSAQRRKSPPLFQSFLFGISLPRPDLYARIDARAETMVAEGFVDEVKELLNAGYAPDLPAFSSVGYREIVAYLEGSTSLQEAASRIKVATHRLARSQDNWFLSKPAVEWRRSEAELVRDAVEVLLA